VDDSERKRLGAGQRRPQVKVTLRGSTTTVAKGKQELSRRSDDVRKSNRFQEGREEALISGCRWTDDDRHSAVQLVAGTTTERSRKRELLQKINNYQPSRQNGMVFAVPMLEPNSFFLHLCEENKIMRCDGRVYSI
jgi:hypothetical protein